MDYGCRWAENYPIAAGAASRGMHDSTIQQFNQSAEQ
jgi:hypothetical protein